MLIAALAVLLAAGAGVALWATGVFAGSSGESESSFVRGVNTNVLGPLDQVNRTAAAHASVPDGGLFLAADGGRIVSVAGGAATYLHGLGGLSGQQRQEAQLLLALVAANQAYGRALAAFTPSSADGGLALAGAAAVVRATLATVHDRLSTEMGLPSATVFVASPATIPTPAATIPTPPATPTTTLAAVPSAPAPRTLLPSESATQMTQEIRTVLLQFHSDVVAGDTASAWQLLSGRKRQIELVKDGYPKWAAAQKSLAPYLDPSGLRVRFLAADAASAVVTVDVTGMKWSAPGAKCAEWSGITWMKYEQGTWKYDPGYSTTAARKRAWTSRYNELLGARC